MSAHHATRPSFWQRLRQLGAQGYLLCAASLALLLLAALLIAGVSQSVALLREPPPALLPQELPYHARMPGTGAEETAQARKRFQRNFARWLTFSGYKAQATWDAVWATCPDDACTIPPAAGGRLLLPFSTNPAYFEKQFCDFGLLAAERRELGGAALRLGEEGCRIADYEGYRLAVAAREEARRSEKMPQLIWTGLALLAALLGLVLIWRRLLDQLSKL
ncbi:hypothetical protein [Chitinilyticum litopenaei]|uniref:hypothetical protein n=1 Tax=Chitinilyticum litopenaei TaxID=1121276 RepID=UPI0003F99A81|nr:hypothetical protein [Chitinilyticum litopenaei]